MRVPKTQLPRHMNVAAVRNIDGGSYLEAFLVSAVAAILVIRLYLELTGYPQIGGGGIHVAHVLWGGLLMLIAQVMLLAFLGKHVKRAAAVIGGIGFGAFIDELGKFLTSDNDYFFRPTAALIYVFFIGLFLTFRWIERRRERSQEELLVNAADMVKEILIDGAQSDEVDRAIALLRQSGDESGIALALRQSILSVERGINHPPSAPARIAQRLHALHGALIQHRWFHRMTLLVFAGNAIAGVLVVILTVAWDGFSLFSADERSLAGTGQVAGASLAWCCSTIGTIRLRQSRISAYRWFKRSVLAMIFFAQVFLFIQSQALALAGLAANLLLLGGINAMLRAEYLRREASQEP